MKARFKCEDNGMTRNLTDTAVVAFLEANPDFFATRENLLLKLQLPHKEAGTISLIEKQLAILRENHGKTRMHLDTLMDSAEINHEIFEKSRKLILNLIAADTCDEFFAIMEASLAEDFKCPAYSLTVFNGSTRTKEINHFTSSVSAISANEEIGALMRTRTPTLGVLRPAELNFLFRKHSDKVKSAAVLTINPMSNAAADSTTSETLPTGTAPGNHPIALLAIGSKDAHYFTSDMDTSFLGFITDTLGILIPRHLPTR